MNLLKVVKIHRYELIALLTGACVMMLEIVGARLLAPYFGLSTYVWTAMIGVILAALSIGFWAGGRSADRNNPKNDLSLLIVVAAILILIMVVFQRPVLQIISENNIDLRLSAILAAIVLFGIPSALIGMISPHLAKIQLTSLKTSGATIGRLEAAGAIGSIIGTFASGYFLLSYFGSRDLSIVLALTLVATSFLADHTKILWIRFGVVVVAFILFTAPNASASIVYDTDTAYSRYQVQESIRDGKLVRYLVTDSYSIQSAFFPDEPTTLVFNYTETIATSLESLRGQPKSFLVIGGGSHTLPTYLHATSPGSQVDVVEIDPKLDEIAEDYFGYKPSDGLEIFHQDGRDFLNNNDRKYDAIVMDAYTSLTPPFHLSSREAIELIENSLTTDGTVHVNIASTYEGGMLSALLTTYSEVFNHVGVIQAEPLYDPTIKQNYILIATNSEYQFDGFQDSFASWPIISPSKGMLLTDDYAPVDRLSY